MESIGDRIKQVRGSLTQAEFATAVGDYSPSNIGDYETGRAKPPHEFMQAMTSKFHVDLHWLITGDAKQTKDAGAPYYVRADVQQIAAELLKRPRLLKLVEKMIQADEKLSRDADALARAIGASREKAYLILMLQKEEL